VVRTGTVHGGADNGGGAEAPTDPPVLGWGMWGMVLLWRYKRSKKGFAALHF
jgi:hypothetical protein